jgi:hypothetical protein
LNTSQRRCLIFGPFSGCREDSAVQVLQSQAQKPAQRKGPQGLAAEYGGSPADWRKVASENYNPGGAKGGGFETHAYQNVKTGQVVEMKTKFQ